MLLVLCCSGCVNTVKSGCASNRAETAISGTMFARKFDETPHKSVTGPNGDTKLVA